MCGAWCVVYDVRVVYDVCVCVCDVFVTCL